MKLGTRMKENYEDRYRFSLTRRIPVIMRLDGKAFHTLTKHCQKPFDSIFQVAMSKTALKLCKEIQGAKIAYVQSDEISILITDFDKLTTESWFDYNIQKMTSVAASMASVEFSSRIVPNGFFDCRVFNIPEPEVVNYFVWRQKDWERNSIQMLGQAYFSHKELHSKKSPDIHEMLHQKGVNWANLEDKWKNGQVIFKDNCCKGWNALNACPIFTLKDTRDWIEDDVMAKGN